MSSPVDLSYCSELDSSSDLVVLDCSTTTTTSDSSMDTSSTRKKTGHKKSRADTIRQKLANVQDVKLKINSYKKEVSNREGLVVGIDHDIVTIRESLAAMEEAMTLIQQQTRKNTANRRGMRTAPARRHNSNKSLMSDASSKTFMSDEVSHCSY